MWFAGPHSWRCSTAIKTCMERRTSRNGPASRGSKNCGQHQRSLGDEGIDKIVAVADQAVCKQHGKKGCNPHPSVQPVPAHQLPPVPAEKSAVDAKHRNDAGRAKVQQRLASETINSR